MSNQVSKEQVLKELEKLLTALDKYDMFREQHTKGDNNAK